MTNTQNRKEKAADKTQRIFDLYFNLVEGKTVKRDSYVMKYGIDNRTFDRDIGELRAIIAEANAEGDSGELLYDREKGYILKTAEHRYLQNSELLAVSKIIIESRAFSKTEMKSIIKRLIGGCVSIDNKKIAEKMTENELYHYVELHESDTSLDMLWELGDCIKDHELITITYKKLGEDNNVERVIEPVAIIFSEYYFYLIAYLVSREAGEINKLHSTPTIYRIDRISEMRKMNEKFPVQYSNRFEEGEFRKRVPFMFSGGLNYVQFTYNGLNINAVLDRLPTAEAKRRDDGSYLVKAEAYGDGIFMWILSQGDRVEVIGPPPARKKMKELVSNMVSKYEKE